MNDKRNHDTANIIEWTIEPLITYAKNILYIDNDPYAALESAVHHFRKLGDMTAVDFYTLCSEDEFSALIECVKPTNENGDSALEVLTTQALSGQLTVLGSGFFTTAYDIDSNTVLLQSRIGGHELKEHLYKAYGLLKSEVVELGLYRWMIVQKLAVLADTIHVDIHAVDVLESDEYKRWMTVQETLSLLLEHFQTNTHLSINVACESVLADETLSQFHTFAKNLSSYNGRWIIDENVSPVRNTFVFNDEWIPLDILLTPSRWTD